MYDVLQHERTHEHEHAACMYNYLMRMHQAGPRKSKRYDVTPILRRYEEPDTISNHHIESPYRIHSSKYTYTIHMFITVLARTTGPPTCRCPRGCGCCGRGCTSSFLSTYLVLRDTQRCPGERCQWLLCLLVLRLWLSRL